LGITALHHTEQNSSDNLPSDPPDHHHGSEVYLMGRAVWFLLTKTKMVKKREN